jgi:hypothetical protein
MTYDVVAQPQSLLSEPGPSFTGCDPSNLTWIDGFYKTGLCALLSIFLFTELTDVLDFLSPKAVLFNYEGGLIHGLRPLYFVAALIEPFCFIRPLYVPASSHKLMYYT